MTQMVIKILESRAFDVIRVRAMRRYDVVYAGRFWHTSTWRPDLTPKMMASRLVAYIAWVYGLDYNPGLFEPARMTQYHQRVIDFDIPESHVRFAAICTQK